MKHKVDKNRKVLEILHLTGASHYVAGYASGICSTLAGYPLDTVKVRLQKEAATFKFKGMFDCMKQTFSTEGILGFYKGVTSPLMAISIQNGITFYAYRLGVKFYDSLIPQGTQKHHDTLKPYLFSAAVTGFLLSFLDTPVELVKATQQVQYHSKLSSISPKSSITHYRQEASNNYNGSIDCATKIFKNHGIRGLYAGLVPTLFRNIPGNIFYFGIYEYISRILEQFILSRDQDAFTLARSFSSFFAGGIAGTTYWTLAYPLDVIKTNIQTDNMDRRKYLGTLDCASKLYKTLGVRRAFFSGFAPCIVRAFPVSAINFFVYSWLISQMNVSP